LYPTVVGAAYVALVVVANEIDLISASRVIVITTLSILAVSALINLLMRDRNRAGVPTLALVFLALFGEFPRIATVLFVIVALVSIERVISVWRPTRVPWRTITLVGNVFGLIVVVIVAISGLQNGTWGRLIRDLEPRAPVADAGGPAADRPDVYVILLDGYERPSKMREVFGFDDEGFASSLEERGFVVASQSRANYLLTTLSVPSLLNMKHVADLLPPKPAYDAADRSSLRSFSEDNEVFRVMKRLGYETVTIPSGFDEVTVRAADQVLDPGDVNEFEIAMARTTAVGGWIEAIAPTFFDDSQRSRVIHTLDMVAGVAEARDGRPLFAFAHVASPHGPMVFGPDGEAMPGPGLDKFFDNDARGLGMSHQEFSRRYIGQVRYLNARVLDVVDRILAASAEPPILVLLADHGSGMGMNWQDVAHSDLDERSANLFAAFTPGRSNVFPDDISLVNVFGTLFAAYYGVEVAHQPDAIYRWDDRMTSLIPVARDWAAP